MSHNSHGLRAGEIAVIFVSQETGEDPEGYGAAAAAMVALAEQQPGYRGIDSTRDASGFGITVSYWADEESAVAWRQNPEHAAIRDQGRERWYQRYELFVSEVRRGYSWER
ncbi:antibiotic biosynthesis monooxygenase [Sphingomonas sp. LB-2]|uniref:antibiotic biosynthesis monooxygenase family protein n=1 Tax=Sphingomonas caeni TaxID=2984949 RepID=UPI00222F0150|nr:antibiotic biosynthesis monooxygenase [Sphingomonas caeni]MCW3846821.1 antibiotic biosynthesis monooxygenase [Sphingomonas caeni]